ncbi:hypothetical protein GGX14DRAFT_464160 [Mycena pura]|uniref:Uncharacterized protein n=1 Tax=Mycena pura TaxID=153505 RepID=A0AAD6V3I5_9AGAR|nr:hypothetical protein GGX14DRAFT_464160 [Mycena pura]
MEHPQMLNLSTPQARPLLAESTANDWLAHMILAVKTVAAGAEFIPLPYLRAAFGTVVVLLETVDKMKKNRDDLRDLCASTFEIVLILRTEISAHGQEVGPRFMSLCEDLTAFLHMLQTGLENLIQRRATVRGRLKEFISTASIRDRIERYRNRVDELRSNFLLVATIENNCNMADIQKILSALNGSSQIASQFRQVPLGDINLLHEPAISNKVHKIKVFTARISGQPSTMTVAQYQDDEKWKRDLELCSRFRHPSVWQLFGISTSPGLHGLVYYDELIPLSIYRKFHRPSSDLVWVCTEGVLACSQYHRFTDAEGEDTGNEATICVKRESAQLCLAMPGLESEYDIDPIESNLSSWHCWQFKHQNTSTDIVHIAAALATPSSVDRVTALSQSLQWEHFFATLIPSWTASLVNHSMQTKLFLGSILSAPLGEECGTIVPVGYIPNTSPTRIQPWVQIPSVEAHSHPGVNAGRERFTFLPGCFKKTEMSEAQTLFGSALKFEGCTDVLTSWLSQSNRCIGETVSKGGKRYRYGVVDMLECEIDSDPQFQHHLHTEGISSEVHIFLSPLGLRKQGLRISVDFSESDLFYWSLEPSGTTRLTQDECDSFGLPRLKIVFIPVANLWYDYHYNAIREFFEAKGVDPYGSDVTELMGLPLAEMENAVE